MSRCGMMKKETAIFGNSSILQSSGKYGVPIKYNHEYLPIESVNIYGHGHANVQSVNGWGDSLPKDGGHG